MPISSVQLDDLTAGDIQGSVDNAVREGRRIEYKEAVGQDDAAKREFLADVSSFASASGGDFLIGVEDRDGVASGVPGVEAADVDTQILRLENIIRDGIEPRIPGLQTQPVVLAGQRVVLVMRIPRSWAAPHMVTFRNAARFYSRNSAGKYQLDVGEIRAAFVASDAAGDQLRAFRLERLGRITANDAAAPMVDEPKLVLHLVPFSALDRSSGLMPRNSCTRT